MTSINTSNSGSKVYADNDFANSNTFKKVIRPLGEVAPTILATKQADGACPYVKLDTYNEGKAGSVELRPAVISENASLAKALKGTTNTAKKVVNVFGAWAYNCNRTSTAQALDTTIADLSNIADAMVKAAVTRPFKIVPELEQIIPALKSALKTVFYVYRTYNLNPDQGVESVEDRTKTIGPQYDALSNLIDKLTALYNQYSVKKMIDASDVQLVQPLRKFKDDRDASQWFVQKRCEARTQSSAKSGADAYADLHKTAGANGVPEHFVKFAQSIDQSLKNDRVRFDFVKDTLGRSNNARAYVKAQPDTFEDLFIQLYKNKAPREVFQAVFRALTKENGEVPADLEYAPNVLNAIMNNAVYFPIFDSKA